MLMNVASLSIGLVAGLSHTTPMRDCQGKPQGIVKDKAAQLVWCVSECFADIAFGWMVDNMGPLSRVELTQVPNHR